MQTDWVYNELHTLPLWDRRCLVSLVACVSLLAENAQQSFSAALGNRRKAMSDILHEERSTPEMLLSGHIRATSLRCQQDQRVLIASDTTTMDFTTHKATVGLGPISDKPSQRGFLVHSALALSPEGVPLGLLHQHSWARDSVPAASAQAADPASPATPAGPATSAGPAAPADPAQPRAYEDKESYKWLRTLRGVEKALPSWQAAVLIQDSEADVFEFFSAPRREGLDLLIRACQPRRLQITQEAEPAKLFDAIAAAPVVAIKRIHVPAAPKRVERDACLEVRIATVWVRPPKNGPHPNGAPVRLWVVRASEVDAPREVKEPLEWVLLTTLPVPGAQEALQVLDYYAFRWRIERFHFVLKSGCGYERLQLDRLDTLQKALSLYNIVAWRLLHLTYLAREAPETSYAEVISEDERDVLTLYTRRSVLTVADVVSAVAKLAGFVRVPSAPNPGVKKLWQGFRRLQDLTEGYRLARQPPAVT